MKNYFVILFALAVCGGGCAVNLNSGQAEPQTTGGSTASGGANSPDASQANIKDAPKKERISINPRSESDTAQKDKMACLSSKLAGKKVLSGQTFAVDFEPFRAACFVTFHDPEFTDPPLNSEFYIYRDGKEIFKFPDQFNGITTGCWVEGVGFEDLNDDSLTDVIIAGMCSAKTAPYSENMVYVNTGDGFTTKDTANYKLEKLKKVKDIADFVRKNQGIFF